MENIVFNKTTVKVHRYQHPFVMPPKAQRAMLLLHFQTQVTGCIASKQ
jgi:hypothetical protein